MKTTTKLALLFWVVTSATLVSDLLLPKNIVDDPSYYFSTMVILNILVFFWFLSDANELSVKPSFGLKIGVIALSILFIPYYRFKNTGFKNGVIFISRIFWLYLLVVIIIFTIYMASGIDGNV